MEMSSHSPHPQIQQKFMGSLSPVPFPVEPAHHPVFAALATLPYPGYPKFIYKIQLIPA
jgi:hypothetical protein